MSVECDGDPFAFYQERIVKARKDHDCDCCDLRIRKGDRYSKTTYATEHGERPETVKRCGRCETIYRHLERRCEAENRALKATGCFYYYLEGPAYRLDCGHEYTERWNEEPPAAIAALAFLTDDEAGKLL